MKDVSVIIVNWNTKDLLKGCLESIYNTTSDLDLEVLVVDNASDDGSAAFVRNYFPEVMVLENSYNMGFAKGNNIGINNSNGKYICLINSDIELTDACMEKMHEYLDNNPDIGILAPKLLYPDLTLQRSCKELPTLRHHLYRTFGLSRLFPNTRTFGGSEMGYFDYDYIRQVEVAAGAFWMIRKKALKEVGVLDERFSFYGEDIDFCKRFLDSGWKIVFYPEAAAIHIDGGSSRDIRKELYSEMLRSRLLYWRKHSSNLSLLAIKVLLILHESRRLIQSKFKTSVKSSENKKISYDMQYLLENIKIILKSGDIESSFFNPPNVKDEFGDD